MQLLTDQATNSVQRIGERVPQSLTFVLFYTINIHRNDSFRLNSASETFLLRQQTNGTTVTCAWQWHADATAMQLVLAYGANTLSYIYFKSLLHRCKMDTSK